MIPIPKEEYFEDYINDPETIDLYCENCLSDPKALKRIRKDFEKNTRTFLNEDYPDKIIEGTEIVDGELVQCWYEYDNDNQVEFLN